MSKPAPLTNRAARLTAMYREAGIAVDFTVSGRRLTMLGAPVMVARARRQFEHLATTAGFRFVELVHYDADEDCPAEDCAVYEPAG